MQTKTKIPVNEVTQHETAVQKGNNSSAIKLAAVPAFQLLEDKGDELHLNNSVSTGENQNQVNKSQPDYNPAGQGTSNTTSGTSYQRKTVDELQLRKEDIVTPFKPVQKKENKTGIPDNLKTGVENLSGFSLDDVKVNYNSGKPAQLNALAFAQGTEIHVASGQEKHLPHEAWHVVQQKQGRVRATTQLKDGVPANDDKALEEEADVMGAKSLQMYRPNQTVSDRSAETNSSIFTPHETRTATPYPGVNTFGVRQLQVNPNPAVIQCWTDEEVYTVIRESIPGWRRIVEQIEKEENKWEKRFMAKQLIGELEKALIGSTTTPQNGYRLGRTYEYAGSAANSISELKVRTEKLLSDAQDPIHEVIDEHDELEVIVSKKYKEMISKARELGVETTVDKVSEKLKTTSSLAKKDILTNLHPDKKNLEQLNGALLAELKSYDIELLRLKRVEENQPLLEQLTDIMNDEHEWMSSLEDLLSETTYNKKKLSLEFGEVQQYSKGIRKVAVNLRTLSDPKSIEKIPESILAFEKHIANVKHLGISVEDAHERSKGSGGGSNTARVINWVHTTKVARISQKAFDGLVEIGCSAGNIQAALETIKNAGPGEWNVIKDIGKKYELKVLGSGKYRCESADLSRPISFINKPKKGVGK